MSIFHWLSLPKPTYICAPQHYGLQMLVHPTCSKILPFLTMYIKCTWNFFSQLAHHYRIIYSCTPGKCNVSANYIAAVITTTTLCPKCDFWILDSFSPHCLSCCFYHVWNYIQVAKIKSLIFLSEFKFVFIAMFLIMNWFVQLHRVKQISNLYSETHWHYANAVFALRVCKMFPAQYGSDHFWNKKECLHFSSEIFPSWLPMASCCKTR